MAGDAIFSLPVLALSSAAWDGSVRLPVATLSAYAWDGSVLLPVLVLSAASVETTIIATFSLPSLTLDASGLTGEVGTAEFALPALSFSGAGYSGGSSDAVFSLPLLTLSASALGENFFSLPVLTLSGAGVSGQVSAASFRLPFLSLVADGLQNGVSVAGFSLPLLALSAGGVSGQISSAAFNLLVPRVTGTGVTGNVSVAVLDLPVVTLSGMVSSQGFSVAAFNLPVLYLDARGMETLAAVYRTWVLNTRKSVPTEYDFEFTGYATFNRQVLAVSPAGVVVLGTQDLDGAEPITARVRTAKSDFGLSWLKRVPRIYTGLQQDGDLLFRTITSETGLRTYRLEWKHVEGYTQRRVPVGKGPKSRFWQFEWENEGGADFSIKDLLIYPNVIGRRSQ